MATTDVGEGLLRAAVGTLRPLARRLVAAGVPFGQLEARLRALFVDLAVEDFAPPGRRQTDSRVAVLTGINRKEVRRLRSTHPDVPPGGSFSRNLGANLISRWLGDPRAVDRAGRPLPLPYQAARGPSFVRLARATTRDLPPRALLDALVDAGAAEVGDGSVVALRADAYVPRRGRRQALAMLADDPAELIETMLHNVLGDDTDLRLQRKVAYDNLGSDGMPRLRLELRRQGERFARTANRVLGRYDRDRNPRAPGGERRSAGIGLYYFEGPPSPAAPPRPRRAARRPR